MVPAMLRAMHQLPAAFIAVARTNKIAAMDHPTEAPAQPPLMVWERRECEERWTARAEEGERHENAALLDKLLLFTVWI